MTEDAPPLGWAMIGTGRVGDRMAAAVARSDRARLVAVYSRDAVRGREFADRHGISRVATDVATLVDDPDVDVVYVASPNGLHAEDVTTAAAAGRHVLCEKPLAMTAAECRTMIDACDRAGALLGTAFQFRHAPAHRMLHDLVRSGALGRTVLADAAVSVPVRPDLAVPDWYGDSALAGGGIIPMSGVHRIDLLRYLLGAEVTEVSTMIDLEPQTRAYERTAAAVLRFTDGTLATVRFGLGVAPGSDPLSVHGSAGSAEAAGTTGQWWGHDGGRIRVRRDGADTVTEFGRADLYLSQVDGFCASVTSGAPLAASGTDGLRAAAIVEAMYASVDRRTSVEVAP